MTSLNIVLQNLPFSFGAIFLTNSTPVSSFHIIHIQHTLFLLFLSTMSAFSSITDPRYLKLSSLLIFLLLYTILFLNLFYRSLKLKKKKKSYDCFFTMFSRPRSITLPPQFYTTIIVALKLLLPPPPPFTLE